MFMDKEIHNTQKTIVLQEVGLLLIQKHNS